MYKCVCLYVYTYLQIYLRWGPLTPIKTSSSGLMAKKHTHTIHPLLVAFLSDLSFSTLPMNASAAFMAPAGPFQSLK